MGAYIMERTFVFLSKSASEGHRFSTVLSSDSTTLFEWHMKQGV